MQCSPKTVKIIITLLIAAALFSCAIENQNNGTLILKMPGGANARSVSPAFLDTLTYRIDCNGTASVSRTARAGEAVSIPLAAGDWNVTVTVFNAAEQEIGRSAATPVTIEAGKTVRKELPITLNKSKKDVTQFRITSPVIADGIINQTNRTVSVSVPAGTIVNNMQFSLVHTGKAVSPASGASRNFITPQTFTVTAENGTTKTYTVDVIIQNTGGPVFSLTVAAISNGSVNLNYSEAYEGTTITVTAIPNVGYVLSSIYTLPSVTITGTGNVRTFAMPAADVLVNAVFAVFDETGQWDPTVWDEELLRLIESMTINEKIGQMVQASLSVLNVNDVSTYFLSSVFSGGGDNPNKVSWTTNKNNNPAAWFSMVKTLVDQSLQTRLGIPLVYGTDAGHGHNNVLNATILPHNIGLGAIAAGNLNLGKEAAYMAGRITANEMKATGLRWNHTPMISVADNIGWGRTYECYSSNADIVTEMGRYYIKGLHDNNVASCPKHFILDGQIPYGSIINNGDTGNITRSDLDRVLQPFIAAIEERAMSVKASLVTVNGVNIHEHEFYLTTVLKEELGFKGMVVSEWNGVNEIQGSSYNDKLAKAINAGIDMVTAANTRSDWENTIQGLNNLYSNGQISHSRIDDAVLRILRFKKSMGIFETPTLASVGQIGTSEHREAARRMAAQSLVLLKHENNALNKLPGMQNILLVGTGAANIGIQCGGLTIQWQGSDNAVLTEGVNILDGLSNAFSGNITYFANGTTDGNYDAIITVMSESPYAGGTGDIATGNIVFREADQAGWYTVKTYKENNPAVPVIMIIISGRPVNFPNYEDTFCDAIIAAWLPGSEGGGAIADVLFGSHDFIGKTPFDWHRTRGSEMGELMYPYGYGLKK